MKEFIVCLEKGTLCETVTALVLFLSSFRETSIIPHRTQHESLR